MNEEILAGILKDRYDQAKRNQTILMIDLFGIEYGSIIRENDYSIKRIVQLSGIGASYITEVTKAIIWGFFLGSRMPFFTYRFRFGFYIFNWLFVVNDDRLSNVF